MSESPFKILDVLGKENVESLKKELTQVLLDKFRDDLEEYNQFLIYPPDMRDLVEEVMEDSAKKIRKMYKDAVIEINQDYIDKMKSYMKSSGCDSDKSLRAKIYDLAERYYAAGNEYSKERKFSEELTSILRETQEGM